MKEIKDDTWTDWLLNNKCSRKLSKRTEWSPLTIITIGTLLSVAVFYASLFICYQGFIYYANTILPFHFPLSWYLLGVAILAICISSGMITIVKKYKNSSNKLGNFLYFAITSWFGILFFAGFSFFLVFFSNSYFGSNQSESQVVTLAETKVKRYYHRPLAIHRYVLYLPKNKTYLNYATDSSSYDGESGKHFLLYTHKGLFGWYVADDLREIE